MSWEKKFIEAIQVATRKALPLMVTEGTVTSVDETKKTCNVERDDIPELLNVRLNSIVSPGDEVFVMYPSEGSKVLCVLVENNPTDAYVLAVTKASKFVFNGGQLGGLVKAKELKTQSEKDKDIIDTILSVIDTPVNEPGNGSPSAFQAALKTALIGKESGEWDNLENEKVKH